MINLGYTKFMIETRFLFVVETRLKCRWRRGSGSSRKTRESLLFDWEADLAQEGRDFGPLRGCGSKTRTCVLGKGDAAFRFMKGRGFMDVALESVQERRLQEATLYLLWDMVLVY